VPKLTIDQREVEVPPGATVLDAARKLGIDVPALCFLEGCEPSTSCLCCLVKVNGGGRLVPSCAVVAEEGAKVESETPEIHSVRRKSLELLLSDHLGDCLAPCFLACPAEMDIPQMLRQISSGDMRGAIATVKRDIALPAVLGRICPAPCEKICRRHDLDAAVAICLLKRYAADVDLASGDPYMPPCSPASGKKVAIIGAGPTGLAAAYYLAQFGHACTVFDENQEPGGRLWLETTAEELPRDVLAAEIEQIIRLGGRWEMQNRIGSGESFQKLVNSHDAVLMACGSTALEQAGAWNLKTTSRGIQVAHTYQTQLPNVFAAGNAIRFKGLVVRSVADGKEAAVSVDQYLRGRVVLGPDKPFTTKIGLMDKEELRRFAAGASMEPRREPAAGTKCGFNANEATVQAGRCLHCDCRGLHACKLRKYADLYGADPRRYKGQRREFEQDAHHADVIFEPGKCIDCGLCIQIAAAAGELLGLTFVGRGFNVRVAVPLDRHLDEALSRAAAQCVAACPTAALAFKDNKVS
jgi:NADPH-dependent glutamate synthase beta subunit-like oxidoreductase/ferredoxin